MTVTIELKPETEKRLAKKAEEKGLPIKIFIETFIEDNLAKETQNQTVEDKSINESAEAEEWIAKLKKWSESHDRTTPFLTEEATRRENIY